jgi:hypothetical protein
MIISHTHKFIFVHINKCAGTSITKALLPYLGENDIVLGLTNKSVSSPLIKQKIDRGFSVIKALFPYLEKKYIKQESLVVGLKEFAREREQWRTQNGYQIYKHSTAAQIRGFVSDDIWNDYFTFTFVRNPWDKIVSTYFWYKTRGWTDLKGRAEQIRNLPDFTSYVKSEYLFELSCSSFIFDSGKQIVDFVGQQENIENDFTYICNRIGLPNIKLPNANYSKRQKDYRQYYNEETKQIVFNKYEDDVKNFNYQF